jgi:hypothetical protein
MCSSGQCIPAYEWCDLKEDCIDESDEQDCGMLPNGINTNTEKSSRSVKLN